MKGARGFSSSLYSLVLDAIYPRKCPLCEQLSDETPCAPCRTDMAVSEPFAEFFDSELLDFRAALYRYEGRAAQAVKKLKYSRSTSLAAFMASEIQRGASELCDNYDVVIPVPIHWTRRSFRGFNQAELLCESLPREQLKPAWLRRVRATRPQTALTREERLANLEGAFQAASEPNGLRVLLVDDVLTTGQTARECARALKQAGALEVGVLAFAGEA